MTLGAKLVVGQGQLEFLSCLQRRAKYDTSKLGMSPVPMDPLFRGHLLLPCFLDFSYFSPPRKSRIIMLLDVSTKRKDKGFLY